MFQDSRRARWLWLAQAIWAKGYTELLDLMERDSASRDMHTHVDCYGYGDDLEEVPALASPVLIISNPNADDEMNSTRSYESTGKQQDLCTLDQELSTMSSA